MLCSSCKNLIDNKFKFALTQNICPICGGKIFSIEKRENLIKILSSGGVIQEKMDEIIGEILSMFATEENLNTEVHASHLNSSSIRQTIINGENGPVNPRPFNKPKSSAKPIGRIGANNEVTELLAKANIGGIELSGEINELAEDPVINMTEEMRREEEEMIASGEIVFVNTTPEKKTPSKPMGGPKPISRL